MNQSTPYNANILSILAASCSQEAGNRSFQTNQPDLRAELLRLFGPERYAEDESARRVYSKTTLPRSTTPLAIVWPEKADEVCQLLRLLSQHQVPWHAISRGKNWGYGDACAPTDGCVLIDLRQMNRILEINESLGYAVIEPGVSQGQLAAELERLGPKLMLDVTGAGPDASVVGNALQRGFGHTPYGDHCANSCNYEAVLADGNLVRTGFGNITESVVGNVYPYGNGPCFQGLLAQSHTAVVTRMTVWLMPRPESIQGFLFKTNDSETFLRVVDRIGQLRRSGVVDSVVHIANDMRILSTQPWMKEKSQRRTPYTAEERSEMVKRAGLAKWNGLGGLYGSRRILSAKRRELKKALNPICRVRFFSQFHVRSLEAVARHAPRSTRFDRIRNLSSAISDVYELLCGRPSPNHLEGAFLRNRPESGNVIDAGLIWIAPVIPCTGSDAQRLVSNIEPIANKHGFDLPITISPVTPRAAVCVANLCYDKSDEAESRRANQCYSEIRDVMDQLGYPPYRCASIDLGNR